MAEVFDFNKHFEDVDPEFDGDRQSLNPSSTFVLDDHFSSVDQEKTPESISQQSIANLRSRAREVQQGTLPVLDQLERRRRVKQLFEETELESTRGRIQALPEGPAKKRQKKVFDRLVDLQVQDIELEERAEKRGLSKEAQRFAETPLQKSLAKASQLERIGRRAVSSLGITPVNLVMRGLGALGVEGATEAADNNNRILELQTALEKANDRESMLAQLTSPGISEGVSAIGELGIVIPLLGGGKSAKESVIRLATFYGLSTWDQSITDGKDADLTGLRLQAYALGMGALEAGIMLTFAGLASKFGFKTAEEAFSAEMKHAATRLLSKTGVYETVKSFAMGGTAEAVEEGLTAAAQQGWGTIMGADSLENIGSNVGKAMAIGFFAPGALQLPGKFAQAYGEAVEFAQATGKGVVDASQSTKTMSDAELQTAADATTKEEFETATGQSDTIEKYQESYQEFLKSFIEGKKRQQGVVSESELPQESSPAEAEAVMADTALPTEPVETVPASTRTGEEGIPNSITTALHADIAEDAVDMGLSGLYSKNARSQAMVNAEARQRGLDGQANVIANRVIREGGGLTSVEQEGVKIKWSSLKTERRGLSLRLAETTNQDEITFLGTELTRVREEAELIRQALDLGGSDLGRALVLRRFGIAEDYSPLGLIAQAKSSKRSNLTNKENRTLQAKGQEYEVLEDAIESLGTDLRGKVALKLLSDQNTKFEQEDLRLLYSKAKALFDAGCNV